MEIIKLLQFGSPKIQNFYKELCSTINLSFDDFQQKLIEDTGKSYDELKEFWIDGESFECDNDFLENLDETYINNYLIIHFDITNKSVIGVIIDDNEYMCLTDGDFFFECDNFTTVRTFYEYRKYSDNR